MPRPAPLAPTLSEAIVTDPAAFTQAWADFNGRWITGWLELNALAWAGWLDVQQRCWQQAQAGLGQLPLWANWQFGTEQLA